MINTKFGRLRPIEVAELGKHKKWKCLCDCGNEIAVRQDHLKSGFTKSCGCFCKENSFAKAFKHGMSQTSTYKIWASMKSRCTNFKSPVYKHYGGRGIIVCDRWLNSFENFIEDMGERPNNAAIDRINNNGNYEPSNCRWVSYSENNRNKRNTLMLEF